MSRAWTAECERQSVRAHPLYKEPAVVVDESPRTTRVARNLRPKGNKGGVQAKENTPPHGQDHGPAPAQRQRRGADPPPPVGPAEPINVGLTTSSKLPSTHAPSIDSTDTLWTEHSLSIDPPPMAPPTSMDPPSMDPPHAVHMSDHMSDAVSNTRGRVHMMPTVSRRMFQHVQAPTATQTEPRKRRPLLFLRQSSRRISLLHRRQ
mmetsp:Transcript_45819/g.99693  ORF Transcript_45819/g.99693 Transcript_45819/m.99693 type:complete len:205 (+) Transcript_45819:517-1131(+)